MQLGIISSGTVAGESEALGATDQKQIFEAILKKHELFLDNKIKAGIEGGLNLHFKDASNQAMAFTRSSD